MALGVLLLGGCGLVPTAVHVAGPFYLDTIKGPDVYLFRCPDGPEYGCEGTGLPEPSIVKAGGNEKYVVVAQADRPDSGPLRYFYFARVPQERSGWGGNPEKVVGPLTKAEFDRARERLGLPAANITIHTPTAASIALWSFIIAAGLGIALLSYLMKTPDSV
jgi:hypothetical protein